MTRHKDELQHYQAIVDKIDQELDWGLGVAVRQRYAQALIGFIGVGGDESKLRNAIVNYHKDHELVAALQNPQHPGHVEMWEQVRRDIDRTVRVRRYGEWSDVILATEDMIQIASAAISSSVASFRFDSRFRTWYIQVIVRSCQRELRNSQAQKRAGRPQSLDNVEVPVIEAHQPETLASVQVLAELVKGILSSNTDQRLAYIFCLWANHDQSVEEIGKLVHLHPSRVRALLAQARAILQAHPALKNWIRDEDQQPEFRPPGDQ